MTLTPDKPIAGLLAPLFALRREGDLGVGDTRALREFIEWAAEYGFHLVQLLPINETGNDHSPYNAISSVALDPITLAMDAIPDLREVEIVELTAGLDFRALREGPVNYEAVKPLKHRLLERAYENFLATSWRSNDVRAHAFRRFCRDESAWLDDFALFRVLMDEHGGTERWDTWPAIHADATTAWQHLTTLSAEEQEAYARKLRRVQYIQWLAWTQWREVKAFANSRGVALMGDIPFGVSYYSADTWANPELFDLEWSGGCPPEKILEVDAFTKKWGQNWGIPIYHWAAHRQSGFAWWRQRARKVRDIFHLFRIDHILGVFRIYSFPWRPQRNEEFFPLSEEEAKERAHGQLPHFTPHADDTPEHKAANAAQGEELLKALVEECGEHRLVGEDLGVVPDYVRPCLQRLGIAGFKVPQWEEVTPGGALIPGADYERLSLATFATHDHDPIRAMWEQWMTAIHRAEHGPESTHAARDKAWRECRALAHWCGFEVPRITPWSDEIHERLLRALLRSDSWLVVMMITDLFATTQRFNIPGAVSSANWSERLHGTPHEWRHDRLCANAAARVARLVRESGRA